MLITTTWMNLKTIVLNEESKTEKFGFVSFHSYGL
jgi:hypothetical protein